MKSKIQLFAVLAGAYLTSGCIVSAPYYERPVGYGAPLPPGEIFLPGVIIVEGGVRHDRYFYQRHPEYYRRDQLRYPERFAHRAAPYGGSGEYRSHVSQPRPVFSSSVIQSGSPRQAEHRGEKDKKKNKEHRDENHDR